jgi:signal transduction histidine kinase/ActR/RegA family two-component response regulator
MTAPMPRALHSLFGSRASVRGQLATVVLVTTTVALLTMTAALLHRDLTEYRQAQITDLTTEASIVALLTAPAMAFDDKQAAERNLAALSAKPAVMVAAVYGVDGGLYARFVRPGAIAPAAHLQRDTTGVSFTPGRLEVTENIFQNGEYLGIAYLRASYDPWAHVRAYVGVLGMMMLLSLGVALVLSARLRRRITGPVEVLAAVADDIVTRRDPSLRAPPTPLEEFAVVVNAFNSVLDQSEKNENALRVANRRKDDFLATLAHELRNPLAPIRHAARLLGIKGLDPAQGQTARDIIGRQVARMALLLDDLLEVSRITRGRLELRKETVPLVELVKTAVETSRPLIESRHQQFTMRLPDAPVELEVDPLRISQALSNLLTNAAKYTDDGGRIHLEVRCASGGIQFSVSDNGIGIPAAALPTIFEMFSQVDSAIDRSEGGLGIGLALVQGLVALHGGTVEARSEGAGRGSTFTIRLPGSARPPSASEAARQIPARAPRSHGRVLIIDDNLDAATTLAMVLRTYGHVVTTAESGAKGLALGEQQQPDAVILDIGMPEMNGYEVAQRIRRSPWGRSVLLLALTGWGQKEDIERAHAAGFDSHMTKPADPEHIEALLDAFLGSRRAGQDQREASH